MEDEIFLPTPPHLANQTFADPQLPQNSVETLQKWSRKRSKRSYELQHDDDVLSSSVHTSSDPALFSSDETPDAENYAGGKRRKKKTYAGTWWGERLPGTRSRAGSRGTNSSASVRKGKRKFTRNFDSGIFMNSDDGSTELSSDSSFGADLIEDQKRSQALTGLVSPSTPVRQTFIATPSVGSSSPRVVRSAKKSTTADNRNQIVVQVVRKCLDDGIEDVDLIGMSLETLPLEIRELATMIKEDPASSVLYGSLVARPRLYLANNRISTFPSPILELSNLRLLSLRQNRLTRLPSGIRNLVKLETLNVSANMLETLPIEVLDLMSNHRLVELQSEPNPWLTCTEEQKKTDPERTRISSRPRLYLLRIPGHNDDDEGLHTLLSLTATSRQPLLTPESPCQTRRSSDKVPSLSELVLRQLSKVNQPKRSLTPLMPPGTSPRVTELLDDLHTAQSEGDRRCARCKRLYVTPAEKWIEWWDIKFNGMSSRADLLNQTGALQSHTPGHILPFEVGVCESCV